MTIARDVRSALKRQLVARSVKAGAAPIALAFSACTSADVGRIAADGVPRQSYAVANGTEATRKVGMAFLNKLFVEGDVAGAYDRFAASDFIQHNPEMADGIAGHHAFFEAKAKHAGGRAPAWANVTNIIIVDGDLFAVHHQAFITPTDPGRTFVDIWRVKDGRIVEHWDVIQPIPATMAHSNGMGCGKGDDYASARASGAMLATPACGLPNQRATREKSLQTVNSYASQLLSGDVTGAIRRWFSAAYLQHSPVIADGAQAAIDYLRGQFGAGVQNRAPMGPARVIAEGDYVLFHRMVDPGAGKPQSANIDIFRVTDGLISEHWDLKQAVPAQAANQNGMW